MQKQSSISKWNKKMLAVTAQVLQKTQSVVISRSCFTRHNALTDLLFCSWNLLSNSLLTNEWMNEGIEINSVPF